MWILLPAQQFRGPHNVFVPNDFGKTEQDFASTDEFLSALRAHHLMKRRSRTR